MVNSKAAAAFLASFHELMDDFRNNVIERHACGETESSIDVILTATEKTLSEMGWDDGTRILVIEKMRGVVREVYGKTH